jgi:glycosyltransferase involved in cell wall biosynthesis
MAERPLPLVSIAMGTYNGEPFIAKQIKSILHQTYNNIELIIVDDGSSDRTCEIVKSFQNLDIRIKLYQNEANLGFNKNFEKAIRLCSGAYIAISDQDDIWLENKIERLLVSLEDNLMVYANSAHIDEQDNLLGTYLLDPNHINYNDYKNILLANFVTGHTILFRTEALDNLLPIPQYSFYDWWFGFIMLYEGKLAYCNEVLTYYRIHNQSVIRTIEGGSKITGKAARKAAIRTIVLALGNFINYKGIAEADKGFISDLQSALIGDLSSVYRIKLCFFLLREFKSMFPRYTKGVLKRPKYLYKYLKEMKWP